MPHVENNLTPSVDLAARALKLLTRYNTARATLTEITSHLDVSKSSALRVLRTLTAHGLVHFDPETKKYSLGTYALILGARAEENIDYMSMVRELLATAAEQTGLTSVFVQRVGDERMMYVAKRDAPDSYGVTVSIGNQFPITDVSYGQWLLAYLPETEREKILANGLRRVTDATTTDRQTYLEQVERIRHEGVLVSRGEYVPGIVATSAPILTAQHELLGVLATLDVMPSIASVSEEEVVARIRALGQGRSGLFPGTSASEELMP